MLSKEDYLKYLDQIKEVETTMAEVYADCARRVDDEEVKKTCLFLLGIERKHASQVEELKRIFKV